MIIIELALYFIHRETCTLTYSYYNVTIEYIIVTCLTYDFPVGVHFLCLVDLVV